MLLANPPRLIAPPRAPFFSNPLSDKALRRRGSAGTPTAFWFAGDVSLGYE
jgi:hypothetical protein